MLKYILLAGAMTFSVPALAQDKPMTATTAPTTEVAPAQSAPSTTVPNNSATPQSMTPADPATTSTPAQDSQAAAQSPAADPTAQPAQQVAVAPTAEPVTGAAQIAQVVDTEFASYDTNKNGILDKTEFAAWMVALKEKSDPSTKPDSPATKAWVAKAFASADKDKSKSVSKTELTGFLSQGA